METASQVEVFKILFGAFGGSGAAFFVAWVVFRSWKEALAQKDVALNARIEAVERAAERCSQDRAVLHTQMFELQSSTIAANTAAMLRFQDEIRRHGGPSREAELQGIDG